MKISVRGKNDRLTKKEIRDVIVFATDILLGKKLSKNIQITVLNSNLKKYEWGYCGPTDWDNRKHREFEILLNHNTSKNNQIITLLHEIVHIKQYARDELKQYDLTTFRWLGKRLTVGVDDYQSLPWEKEAHQTELVLMQLYKEHMKNE